MMYNYPFFSFPHMRRYPHYPSTPSYFRYPVERKNTTTSSLPTIVSSTKEKVQDEPPKRNSSKGIPSGFSFLNQILHQENRGEDEEYFNLFGLKLYHDDLLLLGLIFFLYKEDVKDSYLFFALVLLLIS